MPLHSSPGGDLGVHDGTSPAGAVESVVRRALDVARGERAVLVVPPEHMAAFAPDADEWVEAAALGEAVEVVCRGPLAAELLAAAASGAPPLEPEVARLLLPTAGGGLTLQGVALPEEDRAERVALLRELAAFASASASWAARLVRAERRAADAEAEGWALRADCARLRELAEVDELTGLYNRRFFDRQLDLEMERLRRYGHPVALALVDLDHFKRVNDAHGHPVGDAALRRVAEVARGIMRKTDYVVRIGGDELAVLMPNTSLAGALVAAERLRASVAGAALPVAPEGLTVTLSVGVAGAEGQAEADAARLFEAADRALYRAKEKGRNRVERSSRSAAAPEEPGAAPPGGDRA